MFPITCVFRWGKLPLDFFRPPGVPARAESWTPATPTPGRADGDLNGLGQADAQRELLARSPRQMCWGLGKKPHSEEFCVFACFSKSMGSCFVRLGTPFLVCFKGNPQGNPHVFFCFAGGPIPKKIQAHIMGASVFFRMVARGLKASPDSTHICIDRVIVPAEKKRRSLNACCLEVRTLTFCQLLGFPSNH